ncbi:MAG: response regulator [Candidatus Omnitrophica bacterium]|nr:response regulator [Candidatus Omnitrophota bacterium]
MNERILVVDDELGIRESLRMMLSDEYEVTTTDGGNECLRLLKKDSSFSLLIVDVKMPDLSGIEVLKRVKKTNPFLPVIILTAVDTHEAVVEALKFGAEDFVAKPVDMYHMQEVIKKALSKSMEKKGRVKKKPISVDEILSENFMEAIQVLTEIIEAKDPYLKRHSKWTTEYAIAIADKLELSKEQINVIRQTCLLHDIGKVGISDVILQKKTKLSREDWEALKKHPVIGEKILENFRLLRIEQKMVRHHHERYDGSGYPDGLEAEEIPLYARILSVADAFESMTAGRVYKSPLSIKEAIEELKTGSGTQFDSQIVTVFIELILEKW